MSRARIQARKEEITESNEVFYGQKTKTKGEKDQFQRGKKKVAAGKRKEAHESRFRKTDPSSIALATERERESKRKCLCC